MSIDKFGHHISTYNRDDDNVGYYKILLRFESKEIDPKTRHYKLFNDRSTWIFPIKTGSIKLISAYPEKVVILLNKERYFAEEMKNVSLSNKDEISFVGIENEHLFVEMLVECPIEFHSHS